MVNAALVIPAWNEAESIAAVLREVPPGSVSEVIVAVGSLDDPTCVPARQNGARVVVQEQHGYGAACWSGFQAAVSSGAEIVAFLDGDYSDPPAALSRVLEPLLTGRADLVLGCRDLSRYPGALPLHARVGNWVVRGVMRALSGKAFSDLPSFKAIRADALQRLQMREMTYGWTVEMLLKAASAGLRIEEVTVEYRPRLAGRSKVAGSVRGSVGAAWKLLGCAVAYGQ